MSKEVKDKSVKKRKSWIAKLGESIKSVIHGDFLIGDFFIRNVPLFFVLALMALFYVSNRYQYEQKIIEKLKLQQELQTKKFKALTRSAELMDKSRQSKIEEYIKQNGSDLTIPTNPPYIIK